MKPGEFWKIGEGLWCQIGKVKDGKAHFDVINGAWEGYYDIEKKRIYIKWTRRYVDIDTIIGPLTREEVVKQCGY